MVGGNLQEDNRDIWTSMVQLAGGEGVARIGIITAANSNPANSGQYYIDMFSRYNVAEAVWIPVTVDDLSTAQSGHNVNMVRNMTGIFLGGGDPWRLAAALMMEQGGARVDSSVMEAVRAVWQSGGFLGGTSAGIMALTDLAVITGGDSWEALAHGAVVDTAMDGDVSGDLTYDPLGGLQVVRGLLLDAHFHQKGRQGRLARLAAHTGTRRALGLDEDTALVCPDLASSCRVIGTQGVWTLDTGSASCSSSGSWSCSGLVTSYLTQGDSLNLADWSVTFSGDKTVSLARTVVISVEPAAATSEDVFRKYSTRPGSSADSEYHRVAASLLYSHDTETTARTRETGPRYEARFRQTEATRAVKSAASAQVAYTNLVLDLAAV